MPDSCLSFLQSYALKFLSLNLDCRFGITDNELSLVAASCSSLEVISLISILNYRCLVTTLANGCSALKHIHLSYCSLVSDSGRTRINLAVSWRQFNVSHCSGVNGSGLGGFSPTSTHIDADSCKLEPKGIIGIVSGSGGGGGGGVEYLNVSCMKWCVSGGAVQQ